MKVITKYDIIENAAETWKTHYSYPYSKAETTWFDDSTKAIYYGIKNITDNIDIKKLSIEELKELEKKLTEIIGNRFWIELRCDECFTSELEKAVKLDCKKTICAACAKEINTILN